MSVNAFLPRRTGLAVRCGLAFLAISLAVAQTSDGQLFSRNRINSDFIPASGFAGAAVFPKQLAENPKFDLFPREIVTAWGKKQFGFDPMLIRQITFIVRQLDGLNRPPKWAAVLHFQEIQGLAGTWVDQLDEKQVGGKSVFSGTANGLPSFLIYDEATMFMGDEPYFVEMLVAENSGKLVELFEEAGVKGQLVAFVDVESVRSILNEAMMELPGVLPPAITKLKKIPNLIDAIEIGVHVDGRVGTELILHAADDDSAKEVHKIIAEALEFGGEMGIGMLAAQMDFSDPVQVAIVEYAQRVKGEYENKLTPSVNGSELEIKLDEEATVLPVLIGMLLPAFQQTRVAAHRAQSMNNSRQMVLATLNYESAYGKFPAQGSYDEDGKPLLSWRVHVLPFIDQQELYEQFRLDEPWDSPHNKKLIKQMPAVYQSPTLGDLGGKTVYLGVAGEGMAFDEEGKGIAEFTDGTSNTILTVEVNPEQAVVWTKPDDWSPNADRPKQGLGGVQPGGFIVSFADGSAHFVSNDVDPETWRAMLTIGGGEVARLPGR